jgi:glycosyltransferase involved in cell wall biosynthesis
LVENAKSIHFIGKSEIQGAKELFAINNYQLVPNGQNLGGIYISRINKNDTTFPIFGFCGRLDVKTKGLDILMKGFAEYLSKNEGKSELWLIGDGERKYDLMLLAQNLGISNQVFFLGSLYGQEKVDTIKQLDYFTLTSRNEGLPGVILEASVLGVPCIVSEATNMGDFIKTNKAGIVLEKNTPSSISKALKTALTWKQNGRIVRIKHNAKKMVINQFNWTRIVRQLDQLYA